MGDKKERCAREIYVYVQLNAWAFHQKKYSNEIKSYNNRFTYFPLSNK